jgi:uncharacterized protein YndB with AHSA1/START domain
MGASEGRAENEASSSGNTADRAIFATRIFAAPRELVWKLWTEPEHLTKWWGPKGFATTISEIDVKPGGAWHFVMRGPDGKNYPNKTVYLEVVKPERIVYDHESYPPFLATANFEAKGEKTKFSMRMVFESAEMRDKTDQTFGTVEGLKQTVGLLEELVANSAMVVERTFDAPVEKVWKAITEGEQMMHWFMKELKSFKAEVGFETEFTVHHEGKDYPRLSKVLELVPERKLSVEWKFGGMSGVSVATMELFAKGGKTRLLLTHEGVDSFPQDKPDFRRGSFQAGWKAIIGEQLAEYLAKG